MAKIKCALCGRNLKDGEWKYLEVDGDTQKVCMNKYRCDTRRRVNKSRAERQQAAELENNATESVERPVEIAEIQNIGNYTRRYLELAMAVLGLVVAIVAFCMIAGGSV